MTIKELTEALKNIPKEYEDEEIMSIGACCGIDRESEYVIHTKNNDINIG